MAVLEFKKRIKHDPTWFVLHGTMIPSTSMGIFLQIMVLSGKKMKRKHILSHKKKSEGG
uniref:Uncharacterized protein n=1 Tax=Brassica oleracea TaxID=3712 RepID=A0A3P6AQ72_BRAOL|nr:unnamed protein product [Brassica oleracea]